MTTIRITKSNGDVSVLNLQNMHTASLVGDKLTIQYDGGHQWFIEGPEAREVMDGIIKLTRPWWRGLFFWGKEVAKC